MIVRVLLIISVVLQLQFPVDGNCTTELSETDAEDAYSSGDVVVYESEENNQNSTELDEPNVETKVRKRSALNDGVEAKESNMTSSHDFNWGVSKEEAKTSILEEVSSDLENESNANVSRPDRDSGDQNIYQPMIDLAELDIHKNSDTIDVDADKLDGEGHMTVETMIDLGELDVHKSSDTIDVDADKLDIDGHVTSETVTGLGVNNKSSDSLEGSSNVDSESPTKVDLLHDFTARGESEEFDSGDHSTPGLLIDFEDESKRKKKFSTNTQEDSSTHSPQDGPSTEKPVEVTTKSHKVHYEDGKRSNRNVDNQGVISNGSTVDVIDKSTNKSTEVTHTLQGNFSAVEDDLSHPSQGIPSSVEPLAKRIYRRVKRQEMEVSTDSAIEVDDILSTASKEPEGNDTSSTTSTDAQINDTTSEKNKLKRFPSLQYIARKAYVAAQGGEPISLPKEGKFREKRSHVYSINYDDIPESMKSKSFKIAHQTKNRKH